MADLTFSDACVHLGSEVITPEGSLSDLGWYLYWSAIVPDHAVTLDGDFSPEDLRAIATYIAEFRAAYFEQRRTNA